MVTSLYTLLDLHLPDVSLFLVAVADFIEPTRLVLETPFCVGFAVLRRVVSVASMQKNYGRSSAEMNFQAWLLIFVWNIEGTGDSGRSWDPLWKLLRCRDASTFALRSIHAPLRRLLPAG